MERFSISAKYYNIPGFLNHAFLTKPLKISYVFLPVASFMELLLIFLILVIMDLVLLIYNNSPNIKDTVMKIIFPGQEGSQTLSLFRVTWDAWLDCRSILSLARRPGLDPCAWDALENTLPEGFRFRQFMDHTLRDDLEQGFSSFNMPLNHLGILLNCSFWLSPGGADSVFITSSQVTGFSYSFR